ncbi:hsp20/alpha crystallin family domain-containing protein [Phthorimaea operculella]|nr:hsp20/alpha crystallin family domain-containing protein [Phthorimaea operculella]
METVSPMCAILILTLSAIAFAEVEYTQNSESKSGDNAFLDEVPEDFRLAFENYPIYSYMLLQPLFKNIKSLATLPKAHIEGADIETEMYEDDKYSIKVNVKGFAPEDVLVEAVNGSVLIRADHKDKLNNVYSGRQFAARRVLPDDVNWQEMSTEIKDGVLTVSFPKKVQKIAELAGK